MQENRSKMFQNVSIAFIQFWDIAQNDLRNQSKMVYIISCFVPLF